MLQRLAQACARGLQQSCTAVEPYVPCASSFAHQQLVQSTFCGATQGGANLQCLRFKYTYNFKRTAGVPGLIFWAPTTPGLRHKISIDYAALGVYTGEPVAALSQRIANTGGRNCFGRITCRHRGGGPPKIIRKVDYARDMDGVPGVVERLEHDPNRSGFLALVRYQPEGQLPVMRYQLAAATIKPGDILLSGHGAPIRPGTTLPLQDIPMSLPIHNLELWPGKGGQLVRAANTHAVINMKDARYATITLPSGERRMVSLKCRATIGKVSNHLQRFISLGKAGASRKLGRRPSVRGIAMNPVDHPHGGRTNGGRPSCTPWGIYTKGQRTRYRNKASNRFIIVRSGGATITQFVQARKWRAAEAAKLKAKGQASGALQAKPAEVKRGTKPIIGAPVAAAPR